MQGKRSSRGKKTILGLIIFCLLGASASNAEAATPLVAGTAVSGVGSTTATLEAGVNPQGKETLYRFEYGTQGCAVSTCVKTPEAAIPAGSSLVPVAVEVEGLLPATIYHFRIVARNGETATGPERVFATASWLLTGLPDARAYEQTSPVNKNGNDVVGELALVKAAIDGGGITFGSTFGLPGGAGAQVLPSYLARRAANAWETRGLLPPSTAGEQAQVLGWLPDYSATFSSATKLGEPRASAFIRQSTGDGALTVIAPYSPKAEYAYVGASADGSKILFESQAKLPPKAGEEPIAAAHAGVPNLYAWDEATGEVKLAGVRNDATASPQGTLGGSYDWGLGSNARALREGGATRHYYLQDERAVAVDGSVYFTEAGTGQLFLRKNPTQAQSDMSGENCVKATEACTLHVSASEKTNGDGSGGSDSAGPQPAVFQAANADGSRVLFTSPEKLTNDANTGPEQPLASIVRDSIDGNPDNIEPAFIPQHAVGVAVSSEYVYWADPAAGTIGRAKLDGDPDSIEPSFINTGTSECSVEDGSGGFETTSAPSRPRYVALDSEYIYWTNTGPLNAETGQPIDGCGSIGRAKLDDTGVDPSFIDGQRETAPGVFEERVSNPQGIAVNATDIYWANAGTRVVNRTIAKASNDGVTVEPTFFQATSALVPYGLALNAEDLYFDQNDNSNDIGFISRVSLGGGSEEFVGTGKAGLRGVALDGSNLYWASQNQEAIGRIPLASFPKLGSCEAVPGCENKFVEVKGDVNGVAVDAGNLYWSVNGEAPVNPGNDLYRYDANLPAGERLTDLTVDSADENGAEVQGLLGASADAAYAYFVANGVLDDEGKATLGNCHTPQSHGAISTVGGSCNLYLWHEGAISFVARLRSGGDNKSDVINWAPAPELFGGGTYVPKTSIVSSDGKTLLFRSQEKLTGYDNEGIAEIYRYHAGDAEPIRCVSCNPVGEAVGKGPNLGSIFYPGLRPPAAASVLTRNLSSDGERAFFETTEALVPADTNGQGGCPSSGLQAFPSCLDVYEWETAGAGSCEKGAAGYSPLNDGCVYLISTGKSEFPSLFADASADGNDAFFFTRQSLVGQDKDELQDVYDARVEGGLGSQDPVPPVPCESVEACHGGTLPAPAESSPATSNFFGPANPRVKGKGHKPKKQCRSKRRRIATKPTAKAHCSKAKKGKKSKT